METIDDLFSDYLRFVLSVDEDDDGQKWCEKTDITEYLEYVFRESVINNWCFSDWYEGVGDYADDGHYGCGSRGEIENILDSKSTCGAIRRIMGTPGVIIDFAEITPESLMDAYLEAYLWHLSVDDLRDILGV